MATLSPDEVHPYAHPGAHPDVLPEAVVVQRNENNHDAAVKQGIVWMFVLWGLFTFTGFLLAFFYHDCPGFLSLLVIVGVCACLWTAFVQVGVVGAGSKLPPRPLLAARMALAALAIAAGAVVGREIYATGGIRHYWAYFERRHYVNVWPDEPADAHRDASAVVFAEGSRLDAARSAGLRWGRHTYCAAPVVAPGTLATSPHAQFWAVGLDCCEASPGATHRFTCGDASNPKARAGLVVATGFGPEAPEGSDVARFVEAAGMASALFGVTGHSRPILLQWAYDIDDANRWRLAAAAFRLFLASMLAIPVFVATELWAFYHLNHSLGTPRPKRGSVPAARAGLAPGALAPVIAGHGAVASGGVASAAVPGMGPSTPVFGGAAHSMAGYGATSAARVEP